MAINGEISTNGYDGRYMKFIWNIDHQSVDNNQTIINWRYVGAGGNSYDWYMAGNFKVVINGGTVYNTAARQELYNGTEVASGQYTISHYNDGTASFSVSCEAGIYYFATNCYGSGSWTLPQIARATQPTTDKTEYAYGETITIRMPRALSTFTHDIQAWGPGSPEARTLATNVGETYSWAVPKDWARYLPNQSDRLTIKVTTYAGGTAIGSKTVTPLKINPTSDMAPVIRIQLTDENRYKDRFGGFVKGQSRIRAKVIEQLYLGATVQSRSLYLNGITYQTSEQVSEVISSAYQSVKATVTDSRGLTSTKYETPTIFDWEAPKIEEFTLNRCQANGTLDNEGSYIKLAYKVSLSSLNNRNTRSMRYGLKKQSETSYTYKNVTLDKYVKNGEIIIPASGEYSWDVTLEVTDAFTSSSVNGQIGTSSVLMDFHYSGRGMAIGKVSEHVDCLELSPKWKLKIGGKWLDEYIKQIMLTLYPVGAVYLSFNATNPGTFIGGNWQMFGQGRTLVGVDFWDRDFSDSDKTGGSKDLPLPIVGGQNIGNEPVYLDTSVMSRYGSTGRGWDVHSSNEIKPAVAKTAHYDKLQPYVTVYMWRRIS